MLIVKLINGEEYEIDQFYLQDLIVLSDDPDEKVFPIGNSENVTINGEDIKSIEIIIQR